MVPGPKLASPTGSPDIAPNPSPRQPSSRIARILRMIGPGVITGASDDDPSGIGTYAMAGAAFGYAMLWTALLTFPLMAGIQYICAKIGLVYGRGLAGIMRKHYSRVLLYPVIAGLVIANVINAAADLAAVAEGIRLLVPIPELMLIVAIGVSILALQIWGSYRLIARIFKWLTLALFAYIGSAFLARPNWGDVLRGTLIPHFSLDSAFLTMFVALLGTTISPYLFFWQANQEVEEKSSHGRKTLWRRKGAKDSELRYAAWDVNVGMFLSNVVMFFIILATAATLHRAGRTDVATATDAAEALRPLAGEAAFVLMAMGLIGSGFLAIPILTGSGAYAVAEAFGWKCGLDEKPGRAKEFYLVMGASTVAAMAINFLGIDAMKALFWTAVINGFLAPPLLVVVMLVANNRTVMGKRVNGVGLNVLGWATTTLMSAASLVLIWTWIHP
jgi:NRAMP (natural resistance-associated macrophage protein)-like metal ion transporter